MENTCTIWEVLRLYPETQNTWYSEMSMEELMKHKYKKSTLFEFLLEKKHYLEAQKLIDYVYFFDNQLLHFFCEIHLQIYERLLAILENREFLRMFSDFLEIEKLEEIISAQKGIQWEKLIIFNLIKQYIFLSHPLIERIYYHIKNNNIGIDVQSFYLEYIQYRHLIPIIYRLIDQYYLECVKHYVAICTDSIIESDQLEIIKKLVENIPYTILDFQYQDHLGNTFLFYLAYLKSGEEILPEIYRFFFANVPTLPLYHANKKGDTIFHFLVKNENYIMMEYIIQSVIESTDETEVKTEVIFQIQTKFSIFMEIRNKKGHTVLDLILKTKNLKFFEKIIPYISDEFYEKHKKTIFENFEILKDLEYDEKNKNLFLDLIDYFFFLYQKNIQRMLEDDITAKLTSQIIHFLDKIKDHPPQKKILKWILLCVETDSLKLFNIVLQKFFPERKDQSFFHYPLDTVENNLLIVIVRSQNIKFLTALLEYQPDLSLCNREMKNPLIYALESKNIHLLNLIYQYIANRPEYQYFIPIYQIYLQNLRERIFPIFMLDQLPQKLMGILNYFFQFLDLN